MPLSSQEEDASFLLPLFVKKERLKERDLLVAKKKAIPLLFSFS